MDRTHYRLVIALGFALVLASVSFAREVTITLTDQEQQELINLLDLAVRSSGLQVANSALLFVQKIQDAQTDASEKTSQIDKTK